MYNLILRNRNQTVDREEEKRFLAMDRYASYLRKDSLPVRVGRILMLSVGNMGLGVAITLAVQGHLY